jgi:hypothetical protein
MADIEALRAFYDRCKHIDWYYDYSDDGRVYERGRNAMRQLEAEAKAAPELKAIFDAWHDYYHVGKPPGQDPGKQKPERP